MTDSDAIGLSERLRDDISQLVTATKHAAFSGAETGVRVKDPSLLLTNLTEAAAALDALQARVKELEAEQAAIVRDYQRMNSQLADEMKCATRAEQERDEAYERVAKEADKKADDLLATGARLRAYSQATKPAYTEADLHEQAGTAIRGLAAAIRQLKIASGPDKEKRE